MHNSILQNGENAATTTNQPLSHQLSLENRRVSDRLRRQGESDEQRQQRLGARRAISMQNKRVSDRLKRDQESQEEHDQRLRRSRERDALARQEESQEQHERLERRGLSDRLRRHQESNEQRLQNRRESVRTRRQQQTVEHWQHNLSLRRFRHETVEQFLADLKIPLDCCSVCQRLVYSKVSSTILAEVCTVAQKGHSISELPRRQFGNFHSSNFQSSNFQSSNFHSSNFQSSNFHSSQFPRFLVAS